MKEIARLIRTFFVTSIREKDMLFWSIIFPILLMTFQYLAFFNISNQDANNLSIPLAMDAEDPNYKLFSQIEVFDIQKMDSAEIDKIRQMPKSELGKYLDEKKVSGIINKEGGLEVANNSMNMVIARNILTEVERTTELFSKESNLGIFGNLNAYDAVNKRGAFYEKEEQKMDVFAAIICNIFAVFSLYGYFTVVELVSILQANQSTLGQRNACSPMKKRNGLIAAFITAVLVAVLAMILLSIHSEVILKMNLIHDIKRTALLLFGGVVLGVCFGLFIGALNFPSWARNMIGVLSTLLMGFMSGMMGDAPRNAIRRAVPFVFDWNPVGQITSAFYRINSLGHHHLLRPTLTYILALSFVLFVLSVYSLSRKSYDSLS